MNIVVRRAEPRDVPAMLQLVKELADYERAPGEVITTEASMLKDGFGTEKVFHALIAEADGDIAGLSIFYVAYSTWRGKIVYLDDLIVTQSHRQHGIGKKLFDETGRIASEMGANQLRWHVLDWNEPAIKFYEKCEASFDSHWITCKLSKEQIGSIV